MTADAIELELGRPLGSFSWFQKKSDYQRASPTPVQLRRLSYLWRSLAHPGQEDKPPSPSPLS
jgi:hypothetical protein